MAGIEETAAESRGHTEPLSFKSVAIAFLIAAGLFALGGAWMAIQQTHSVQSEMDSQTRRLADQIVVRAKARWDSAAGSEAPSESRDWIERTLLELIPAQAGLELSRAGDGADAPWSVSFAEPLGDWALRPSAPFLDQQRRSLILQSALSMGSAALAILILWFATVLVVRAARREAALARMQSNFVADVSHELKTPLALIGLYTETLQSGRITDDAKRSEYFGVILRETARLTKLINNILDFAKIEAGRKEYRRVPTDVGEVVRETFETFRAELDRQNFKYRVGTAEGLPKVEIDPDAIAQVLLNLMSNSVKYSTNDRFLGVDVRPDVRRGRRGVLLSVEDHGIGIRAEDRSRVFEGFFRADDGRVQGKAGTGLGLALVKHIVEAHSGSLEVESRLVKGTAVRVFLPAAESEPRPTARSSETATPGSDAGV
jgi:signal transduction histidine kinase